MHFFTILFLLGEIVRQSAEGAHLYPHKLCNWDGHLNQIRIKRSRPSNQLDSNLEHDDLFAGSPGNNNPSKAPHHLWDVKNHRDAARHAGSDAESEIVGLGGLLTVRALAARAKARASVARASARARFHRPLLLESTPEEFLHENGAKMKVSQNNFLVSDAGVSSKLNFRHNGDQQGNNPATHFSIHQNFALEKPAQQTTAPLQVEHIKNPYHESTLHLPPIGLGLATSNKQRPHTAFQTSTKANNLESQPIIRDDKTTPHVAFPNFEVVVPTASTNLARSAENYEHGQFHPPPVSEFRMPPIIYNPQPEIRVHNIDNSEEVYRNQKPGFSIIPTNWKPPPDSNLYVQREYEETDGQEPILAVLPGKWTHDGGYDTYYYEDYDVIPIAYNIPEDITPNYYGRSAELDEVDEDAVPEQFVGIKKQFQNWEDNPMVWRPKSSTEQQQRVAEPSDKRHFHHGHSHTFIHKHVKPGFSSGFQSSSFIQPTGHANSGVSGFQSQSSNFAQPTGHVPAQHSGFFQSQNADFFEHQVPETSPFLDIHDQGHNPGFFHHGHSITINKQKTTVIAPSDFHKNIEIAQVTGNNNAVSQAQASSAAHQHGFDGNGFIPHNAKFQSAQVSGTQNAVSQSQRSAETAPAGMKSAGLLGAPYLINFPRRSESFCRTHNDAPQKLLKKRSIDNSIDLNDNHLDDYHKTSSRVSTNIVDLLKKQGELFKEIQKSANDKELLFLTELSSNLLDDVEESLKSHLITKRTVPILRLIADPNAKLDVPKTLENMGTVARNSFENKRAPMYHIKNLAGSAKDAFLSTLRIVPQDFLIPSRYKIIDREREGAEPSKLQNQNYRGDEEVKAISPSLLPRAKTLRERIKERRKSPKEVPVQQPEAPREAEEDPYGFSGTFNKVGSMLRESIRSGQDALSHMGEIYHSTRKALATAQHSVPRVILSSMRIPAVQRHQPLLPQNDKIMMVTPKILQLKQEAVGAPHYSENIGDLVGIGNIMDSLGISRPDAGEVGQRRIVFHPANVGRAVPERRPILPDLRARSNFADDQERSVEDILRNDFVMADTSETDAPEDNMRDTMVALGNSKGRTKERPNLVERRLGLRARSNFADDEERSGKAVLRRYFVMADTLPSDTPEGNMRDALNNARERAVEKLKLAEGRPDLRARSNFAEDQEQSVEDNLKRDFVMADTSQAGSSENIMGDTMDALDNAIGAIGATSLRDFILHMKDGLSNLFKEKLEEARDRFSGRLGTPKTSLDYEEIKGKIASEGKRPASFKFKVKNPFSQDVEQESNLEGNNDGIKLASNEQAISKSSQNESVGAGLFLPKQLMTPFMGQPSKMERREFFEELGDREELIEEDENEGQEETPPPDDDSVTPSNQEQIGAINPILLNETFQLSDNRSPLEFLAALNASRHANRTSGSTKGNSEVWEHKCIYARTTTEESTTNVESTTMVNVEEASEATHLEIQHTTIMSAEEDEEATTKEIETVLETDVNSKNQNTQTDNVGRKMITNKALLTPFMGKPFEKETYAYFEPNEDTYGADSDEDLYYLGNPSYENPEQLQVLPTDDAGKKTKGSFRETASNQQTILGVPLEHNLL